MLFSIGAQPPEKTAPDGYILAVFAWTGDEFRQSRRDACAPADIEVLKAAAARVKAKWESDEREG